MSSFLRPKVYGSPGNRTHRRIIIHSDIDSESEESVDVQTDRVEEQPRHEDNSRRSAMVDTSPRRSTEQDLRNGTARNSDRHHRHRRRRRRPSAVEYVGYAEDPNKEHNRRTSSVSEDTSVYATRSAKREDPTQPRRKRRSSIAKSSSVYRTSPEKTRSSTGTSSRASKLSLPARPRAVSTPQRSRTVRTLRSETLQRTRSAPKSKHRNKSPEYVVIEEIDSGSDEDNESRTAHTRRDSPKKDNTSHSRTKRTSTTAHRSRKPSPLPTIKEHTKAQSHKHQRSASVFGNLFGPPRPSVPEAKVECLTCLDDVPMSKSAKLTCGHNMCNTCLKRIFTLSVTDPAHMPPKCCTEDHIPLKHVNKIFDDRFKIRWNRKYQEYMTKNRIYCPSKGCGTWIPPKDITREKDSARKYGTCRRCKTQVCATCNGKRHKSKECPKDESTKQFAEMAKNNGWQRCYNCTATVELKEGCNHMRCRCTAEFCMICGSKWKTCDCPWFNYATVEADRLNHFGIPQVREEIARGGRLFAQPQRYQEELEQRRQQERQDEELARRMQHMDLDFGVGRMNWNWHPPRGAELGDRPFGRARAENDGVGEHAAAEASTGPNITQDRATQGQASQARRQQRPEVDPFAFLTRDEFEESPEPAVEERRNLRRAASARVPKTAQTQKLPKESSTARDRRSAVLAGLNRMSDTGRVDAWRRHVTGEPPIPPISSL